jgi:hypothetical protein
LGIHLKGEIAVTPIAMPGLGSIGL